MYDYLFLELNINNRTKQLYFYLIFVSLYWMVL